MSAIQVRRDNYPLFKPTFPVKIIGLLLGFFLLLGLIAQVQAGQVTLAWDPNSEPDLSGYRLYYGTSPGNHPNTIPLGIVTTHTVTNLTDGVPYYFALTAFDSEGFESAKSNEVSYTPPASQFTLTVSKSGTGTGTVTATGISCGTDCSEAYNAGTAVSLTATAAASSTFTGWTGACTGTVSPCTVTMNAAASVTAAFALKTYTITASAGANGSISPPPAGSTSTTAPPRPSPSPPIRGYQIASVTVDGVSQGTPGSYSFSNVTAAHTIQATFAAVPSYTLTVSKNGTGTGTVAATGISCGTDCTEAYSAGTAVSLTATASASSNFTGWTGACTGTVSPCTVTMNAAASVTAAFALKTYTITASAGANGAISPATGGINVNYGAAQTFTITPNPGYLIAGVTVDGVSQGTPGSYSFSNVTAAHTIQATFAANTYALTVSKTGTGTGTVTNSPTGTSFSAGTSVSLTAAADANSVFTGWTGACSGTTNPCTVTMSANTAIQATFNLETNKPTSSISSPASGATLRHPALSITGGATDGTGSGVQKVEVSTDGGATWKAADGTILWSHSWNVPGNGTYVIKSRATDNVGNVENPGAGVTVTVAPYQPTPVDVSGKQLLVNGTPFTVKGVVYSPVPIGEDPHASPYGDYFTAPYSALHNRDLPVLRTLGANAVRLYHWEKSADHFDFLDQAYQRRIGPDLCHRGLLDQRRAEHRSGFPDQCSEPDQDRLSGRWWPPIKTTRRS